MLHESEEQERAHLQEVVEKLEKARHSKQRDQSRYGQDIQNMAKAIYQNRAEMDKGETVMERMELERQAEVLQLTQNQEAKLTRLIDSPFFGRVDFVFDQEKEPTALYIGMYSFVQEEPFENILYDWRAPVSSLFYDYETGPASYQAPFGKIQGTVTLKRQYRIRNSQMEFMVQNDLTIDDEVLQKEISRSSDAKMKNIVSTIQKQQNAIIRDVKAKTLIIQGAAGSGKTSIALHRAAFLLYRQRQELKAENILILSPNSVFGDYIASVLPELGEEPIRQLDFNEFAQTHLPQNLRFENYYDHVRHLLESPDPAYSQRAAFKGREAFARRLEEFILYMKEEAFQAQDLYVQGVCLPKAFTQARYRAYQRYPMQSALKMVEDDLYDRFITENPRKTAKSIPATIAQGLGKMLSIRSPLDFYRRFYEAIDQSDQLVLKGEGALEYPDVFPLIRVTLAYQETPGYRGIRHLIVDEMQDYSAVAYRVLAQLFPCNKTLLGDVRQSIDETLSSQIEKIADCFEGCAVMFLNKSYRSTYPITQLAQHIRENPNLEPLCRPGPLPTLWLVKEKDQQIDCLLSRIDAFRKSEFTTLAIIAKSEQEAAALLDQVRQRQESEKCGAKREEELFLLTSKSSRFHQGVLFCGAHMSKGIEFDQVIIPNAHQENYHSDLDRSLLYIALTRAMHRVDLIASSPLSPFLKGAPLKRASSEC